MRPLPAALLDRQRDQAQQTMLDRCQLLVCTQTGTDAHNRPVSGYTPQPESVCGVKVASNREVETAGGVVLVDYIVRLPYGTAVTAADRIRLTGQFGVTAFTPVDCEIVGAVQHGSTAVVMSVKRIVHG